MISIGDDDTRMGWEITEVRDNRRIAAGLWRRRFQVTKMTMLKMRQED